MSSNLRESLLSGDKLRAIDALLEQVADKLDAGMCSHCGGPRGEAAGMASLNRQAIKLLEIREELAEDPEAESTRDDLAKRRVERRRAAAAQSPLATIADSNQLRP
jgi:hypothetical protein